MKRVYITPNTRVYNVATTSIIAQSILISKDVLASEDYLDGGDVKKQDKNGLWDTQW